MAKKKRDDTSDKSVRPEPGYRTRRWLIAAVRAARSGDPQYGWLDEAIRRAGYATAGRDANEPVLATVKVLAVNLGVSERTVRRWMREGLSVAQRSSGGLPDLIDVFAACKFKFASELPGRDEITGEIIVPPGSSVYTERLRLARAIAAERENRIAEGELIDRHAIARQLLAIAGVFRDEAEAIQKVHGVKVGEAIRRMVARAEAGFAKLAGPPETKGE